MSVEIRTAAPARNPLEPGPLILGAPTDAELSEELLGHVYRPRRGWILLFLLAAGGTSLLLVGITVTLMVGIGAWGNNIPVAWGFGIINFVWWIGIGHAGTLISAILLLFQQKWRTSINRFAEAMTLFAVMQAGLFPLLHVGRPWFAYWLFPYPSTMAVWPNFKSPLIWDVFAVSTYFTVSLLFWYLGLIPDLAALRDTSKGEWRRRVYGVFALGWRGSARAWRHYRIAYLLLAGLATPLVLSVHTIVSFDFAVAQLPGWHTTIFPPYFVAGAVFSGFAMVLTLIIPARRLLGLERVITMRHIETMNKVLLVTGLMVAYGYLMEHFIAWYSGNPYEQFVFINRARGPYAPVYWLMIFCNVCLPQIFWFKQARTSLVVTWIASILVNVGMWCERFIIIVTSLHRDFLPSSWAIYTPTWVDWSILAGTVGFFSLLFLLFLRFLPAVAVTEVKELRHELAAHGPQAGHDAVGVPLAEEESDS
ncbi:NrfD/PsrC family molybdoenzyme membrane anchor subunit [Anaeromyxobacter paludicola]|uniref:Molybdopterin oxidoreductase membrane subunit n=1 Tax=Anaeromyxobacter paludicola TaxID=2918171 RepID=A0ABM7XF49_9BACT|nr:NrfD/PsrC family molybdoenzyme membrane anchor subunit [Anaeromyxobacter paludicola]BDG10518.1 molybdopterin oxidoreductase membrane subunit [Anaeromyxobacter paludicola]